MTRGRMPALLYGGLFAAALAVCAGLVATAEPDFGVRIHSAARYGDSDAVGRMLDRRPELLNARGKLGMTPLHEAAWHGQAEVVAVLLARGADVNALWRGSNTGTDGRLTPLDIAVQHNRPVVTGLLQAKGGRRRVELVEPTPGSAR